MPKTEIERLREDCALCLENWPSYQPGPSNAALKRILDALPGLLDDADRAEQAEAKLTEAYAERNRKDDQRIAEKQRREDAEADLAALRENTAILLRYARQCDIDAAVIQGGMKQPATLLLSPDAATEPTQEDES